VTASAARAAPRRARASPAPLRVLRVPRDAASMSRFVGLRAAPAPRRAKALPTAVAAAAFRVAA
jgi:hypothetical protein